MRSIVLAAVLAAFVGCSWTRDAEQTAFDEFAASSLLKKYEWFKDASAKLDSKLASIQVAENRVKGLEKQYEGMHRKDWNRTDAEQHSIWTQEVVGLKMSYNALASAYNARMSKENYRFCNQGDLPRGATKTLPREFKPYETN
jgi:hypothetical protein